MGALVAPDIEAWEHMYKTLGRVLKKNTARAVLVIALLPTPFCLTAYLSMLFERIRIRPKLATYKTINTLYLPSRNDCGGICAGDRTVGE